MKQYQLKTKEGEVINSTEQLCIEDAILYFSIVKKIAEKELLEIYTIEKNENWNNR